MRPIVIPVSGPLGVPINLTVDGPSVSGSRVPLALDEQWLEQKIEISIFMSANLERSISLDGMGSVLAALEQENQQNAGLIDDAIYKKNSSIHAEYLIAGRGGFGQRGFGG